MLSTLPTLSDTMVIAVAALDELIADLIHTGRLDSSQALLDWVADEATPFVETSVGLLYGNPRFDASLAVGQPGIAMGCWVGHWILPLISQKFGVGRSTVPARQAPAGPAQRFGSSSRKPAVSLRGFSPVDVILQGRGATVAPSLQRY